MTSDPETFVYPVGANRFAPYMHYRLAYEDVPAAGGGDGVPIVMLHDLLVGRRGFGALREALEAHIGVDRPRLILPEARGHGASAALAGRSYTPADMLGECLAVLTHARISRAIFVGQGLGGATTLLLATHAADRVAGAVLIEPASMSLLEGERDPAILSAVQAWLRGDQAAALAAYQDRTDAALDGYFNPRVGVGWREAVPADTLRVLRRHTGALAGTLDALAAITLDPSRLADIDVPVSVVWRPEAPLSIRAVAERIVADVPGATGRTLPESRGPAMVLDASASRDIVTLVREMLGRQ